MRGVKKTEKEIEAWVRAVEPLMLTGLELKTACRKCKIPYTTMKDYYDKDGAIRATIDSFSAQFENELTNIVYQGSKEDPKLALDVMARLFKKRWSLRTEVTGADGEELQNNTIIVTDIRDLDTSGKDAKKKK